jgi:competence protein ComGC
MIGKRILGLLIVVLILLATPLASKAETNHETHKSVYIILIDKLSVYDINDSSTPSINQLVKGGALGLASSRTLRSQSTMDNSLTIGSGNLARTYSHGVMGFNRSEVVPRHGKTAGQLYQALTGIDPAGSALLMVNLPEISAGMNKEKVNTLPGAMGEALRKAGLKVCVLGNGDTGEEMLRAGVAVGMDAHGQIPLGDVGPSCYISSPASFLSYETNYEYLAQQLKRYKSDADLMIIELSDLTRMETADTPTASAGETEKQSRLFKIDNFVNHVRQEMDPTRDLLLIISPSPSQKRVLQKDNFTTVIAFGNGFSNGFLTSGATKRDYIVANTDIAPTVLKFFGLNDDAGTIVGQPMTSKYAGGQDTVQKARDISSSSSTVNRLRIPLIKGYVVLQIFVILLSLLAIFYAKRRAQLFEYLIVLLVAIPLSLLVLVKLSCLMIGFI